MSKSRKTALVVCPGRGTYNKAELGYLARHHADKNSLIRQLDEYRKAHNQTSISELDAAPRFDLPWHTRSDNASSLIYACAYADFLSIDQSQYEIVGVTGNSMGWYIALACKGALDQINAMRLINTMGNIMQVQPGGQIIVPLLDDDWLPIPGRIDELNACVRDIHQVSQCELYDSIYLGGYHIVAGNEAALDQFMKQFGKGVSGTIRLNNHAAFHSPLMKAARQQARDRIDSKLFQQPGLPLIDGRGNIWRPWSSDTDALWDYTLGDQLTEPYHFTRAVQVGVREFAPECLIILGPGNTLGGATAQALTEIHWQGLRSKQDFVKQQTTRPLLISMGLDAQRLMAVKH